MAVSSAGTKHALLCFTTSYALDYQPTEEMRLRANFHYRTAVKLLNDNLAKAETYKVGMDNAVVAAMILIFSNDASRPGTKAYTEGDICFSNHGLDRQLGNPKAKGPRTPLARRGKNSVQDPRPCRSGLPVLAP